MGKGEIAHYEQFLIFPQGFQNACLPEASKGVIEWERVNKVCDNSSSSGKRKKENTHPLVFMCTKWARKSNFSDMVVQQDE